MSDDTLPDSQRYWDEGDTPTLAVTLLDSAGVAIPLANVTTLTLTEWIAQDRGQPGITINSRNAQNVKNANQVTIAATSGLVTWALVAADTAMQSRDTTVLEEKHFFRFDLVYSASGTATKKSYPDYFVVTRKQVTR